MAVLWSGRTRRSSHGRNKYLADSRSKGRFWTQKHFRALRDNKTSLGTRMFGEEMHFVKDSFYAHDSQLVFYMSVHKQQRKNVFMHSNVHSARRCRAHLYQY